MTNKGKLFLIPNIIADDTHSAVIPKHVTDILPSIQHFVVEDVRTARRYLSSLKIYQSIEALSFSVLDKDTPRDEMKSLLSVIDEGKNVGVISESGCPGVADPGALAVEFAHRSGIKVIPLVGPSSLLMALMASGLNGQKFAFHGYLPVDAGELTRSIKQLEEESRKHLQTQIFIETPYRNNQVYRALITALNPKTQVCIAVDITGSGEFIETRMVSQWRSQSIELPKKPAVFLFLA